MTPTPIYKLIAKLIAEAPEEQKGAIICQVTFKTSVKEAMTLGGALRRVTDSDGELLQMTVIGTAQKDAQSPPVPFQAEIYFDASEVMRLEIVKEVKSSGLIVPSGGNGKILPPGLRNM
jgi:hypothetical protein